MTLIGEIDYASVYERVSEAHALAAELEVRCHLVDLTEARNPYATLETAREARRTAGPGPGIDRRACLAILVDPDDSSHDLFIAMLQSAGQDATVFHDRAEAVAHLTAAADRSKPAHGNSPPV